MEHVKLLWRQVKASSALVAAFCVAMLLAGTGLYLLGFAGDWVLLGLILLCPLLHFLFMRAYHQ